MSFDQPDCHTGLSAEITDSHQEVVVAASAMRVLAVDSSAGSAVTGFVGMVSLNSTKRSTSKR